LPNLAQQVLDAGGVLGAAIEYEYHRRRSSEAQAAGNLVAHIRHCRGKASQALAASLLISKNGDKYSGMGPVGAQVDAGHRHKSDARVLEFALNNPCHFAPDLIGQSVVPVRGGAHAIEQCAIA
jgi:hypothetical protein